MNSDYKTAYIISFVVFILSLSMFYIIFLILTPMPLTIVNHLGFLLWSSLPTFILLFAYKYKRWMSFYIMLTAFVLACISLIYESILSLFHKNGNLGAVLSYLTLMVLGTLTLFVVEAVLMLWKWLRKSKLKRFFH